MGLSTTALLIFCAALFGSALSDCLCDLDECCCWDDTCSPSCCGVQLTGWAWGLIVTGIVFFVALAVGCGVWRRRVYWRRYRTAYVVNQPQTVMVGNSSVVTTTSGVPGAYYPPPGYSQM
eukprot:m.68943 g.68943  ORF g.68943 m.68943 type:complete len:120 (+) comp35573_c0_seq1:76-435(+)